MNTRDSHTESPAAADIVPAHIEDDREDVINLYGSGPLPIEERDTEGER